jgi:replicative DNA helicase
MNPLEKTILRHLFGDAEYMERVAPFIKDEYFTTDEGATIFRLYNEFYQKFNAIPSFSAIRIGLDASPTVTEQQAKQAQQELSDVQAETLLDGSQKPWLLEQTEEWAQNRAVYCALKQSIQVMDDPKATRHIIPDLLKEALAVSFDTNIGHDYFTDADARYEFYHAPSARLPFDLDSLNKITAGGVPKKTLNLVLAGTNVGKSLALCHFAANYLRSSKNVLYITCEMAKEWIGQRIDANLMDIPMDDVLLLSKQDFTRKITFLRQSSTGRLVIQEYPTGTAHVGHFRTLLQELRLKQHFVPDVILIDYLTICASSRVKLTASINSYQYTKLISEELRALGFELDVPVWSAAQFNRQGFAASDPGLEHLAEGFAIAMTADFAVALVQTEDLEKLGQVSLIELKNRYNRKRTYQQHLLGMDTTRMKLYELSASQLAASLAMPSGPATGQSPKPGGVSAFTPPAGRRSKPLASLRKQAADSP